MTLPPETAALVERLAKAILTADDGGDAEGIFAGAKNGVHDGDCTGVAHTCLLCQAQHYTELAKAALEPIAAEITRLAERCAELEGQVCDAYMRCAQMCDDRAGARIGGMSAVEKVVNEANRWTMTTLAAEMRRLASPPDHPATSEEETRHG